MSSTPNKYTNFVSEPMVDKAATELPGISAILGGRLVKAGYDKAYVVLGQFLLLKMDENKFKEWLIDTCGANVKESEDCYSTLKGWCDSFL